MKTEDEALRSVAEAARHLLEGFDDHKADGPILDRRSGLRVALEAAGCAPRPESVRRAR